MGEKWGDGGRGEAGGGRDRGLVEGDNGIKEGEIGRIRDRWGEHPWKGRN